jgi:hypothetical protein
MTERLWSGRTDWAVKTVLISAAAGLLCGSLSVMAEGTEAIIDGVVHVKNSATPEKGTETIVLEELWRAGGEDDEETIMGVIVHALTDDAGNLYLLDLQLSQVFVYSADGEMIKTLSREGDGPGEVRRPSDMTLLPDGSMGLMQTFPGKLIKVTTDDEPDGEISFGGDPAEGGFMMVVDVDCRAGNLVVAGVDLKQGDVPTKQHKVSFLGAVDFEGASTVRYWENSQDLDFLNLNIREGDQYNVFPRRWSIGPKGEVFAAVERDAYIINVYQADGTLSRVIEKEFTNRQRTEEETEFVETVLELQLRQLPNAKVHVEETPEAISFIETAPDGSVWVVDSRGDTGLPEGVMLSYSVFDEDGHFVKTVQIACDGDGRDDGLIRVDQDHMVLIRGLLPAIQGIQTGGAAGGDEDEEAAPMEIVYYRIRA